MATIKIGERDVEARDLKPSEYMKLTQSDAGFHVAYAALGLMLNIEGVPADTTDKAAVTAYGWVVLDAVADQYGVTAKQVMDAATEAVNATGRRMGFVTSEVQAAADFSEGRADGSATA